MGFTTQSQEIGRLYSEITSKGYRSLAVTACNPGEGASSLARTLAQRCLLSGQSALLVDLNLYRPSLTPLLQTHPKHELEKLFPAPQLMGLKDRPIALTGVAAPNSRDALNKLRKPGMLEQAIECWHQDFDVVIFDTSPLNRINANNVPAERAAAACDSTLLLVLSGKTSEAQVIEGVCRLKTAGANIGGCVLNDRYNPSLKNELLREVQRLGGRFEWLSARLKKFIDNNRLLTLDI